MTNEQAIKWLKDYRRTTDFSMPQYEDAFDLAIQALQAQADEVCDNDCEHCLYTECPKMTENDREIQCGHTTEEIEKSFIEDVKAVKEQLPDRDLISRQSVIDAFYDMPNYTFSTMDVLTVLRQLPSVAIPNNTGHWKDFAVWVAKEIFDDEWEYNKDAFAEITCRKLEKLGIVRAKDDEWELVEPQESEG